MRFLVFPSLTLHTYSFMAFPSHTWETSICGLRVCPNSCSNKNYFACAALLQQPLGSRLQEAEWGFPRSLWRISVTQWQLITPSISKPERLSCEQNRRQRLVMCFGLLGSNWDTTSCFQGLSVLPLKSWTWGTAQLLKNGQQAYSLLIIDLHTDSVTQGISSVTKSSCLSGRAVSL